MVCHYAINSKDGQKPIEKIMNLIKKLPSRLFTMIQTWADIRVYTELIPNEVRILVIPEFF